MNTVGYKRAHMISIRNQKEFKRIDESKGVDTSIDSSKYLRQQANDLVVCFERFVETKDVAYLLFARSELERILALAMRLSIEHKWDFIEMLKDGVEYEEAVLEDIRVGTRKRDTAKWDT